MGLLVERVKKMRAAALSSIYSTGWVDIQTTYGRTVRCIVRMEYRPRYVAASYWVVSDGTTCILQRVCRQYGTACAVWYSMHACYVSVCNLFVITTLSVLCPYRAVASPCRQRPSSSGWLADWTWVGYLWVPIIRESGARRWVRYLTHVLRLRTWGLSVRRT